MIVFSGSGHYTERSKHRNFLDKQNDSAVVLQRHSDGQGEEEARGG